MLRRNTKIIAVVSGVSLLAGIVLYSISLGVVGTQKEEHLTHIKENAESVAHKESLRSLMSMLDETSAERESLSTRFVKDEEVIEFLALIEEIGREQGVSLETSSLDVVDENEYFEYLVMQVGVRGWYVQVINVLELLENLPYQTVLNNVRINKNSDGSWDVDLGLRVTKFKKHEN